MNLYIKAEKTGGVVIANVFYNFAKGVIIGGVFAVFYQFAYEVAQNAAEIFVAGVA